MFNELSRYEFSSIFGTFKIFPFILVFFVVCVVVIIVKLSRSVEVSESGKVIVRYHSPFTWLTRFNSQVADNRAAYSDRQKNILSFMIRSRNVLEAFSVLVLGLVLSGIGLLVILDDPTQLKDTKSLGILVVGILILVLGGWLFTKIGSDDPFR